MCIWALVERKHCKYVEGVSFHVGGAGTGPGPLNTSTDTCGLSVYVLDVCV